LAQPVSGAIAVGQPPSYIMAVFLHRQSRGRRLLIAACCASIGSHFLLTGQTFIQPTRTTSHSRRELVLPAFLLVGHALPSEARAPGPLAPCPGGSAHCWSANAANAATPYGSVVPLWIPPAGTESNAVIADVRSVLESYPQTGQNDIDANGWSFAVDELSSGGYARLEYKSKVGMFATMFNDGKPFIDDFEILVEPTRVSVRSSSRVGDSDLGVNAKRINYIASKLRAKGWDAPELPS